MAQILQPSEWNMRWAKPPYIHTQMPVGEVYVHHSAGRDPRRHALTDPRSKAAGAFFAMNESAINTKGYSAIDYSMMVHTSPGDVTTIGVARGEYVPAATLDRNSVSKAICLLGWFHKPDPNQSWTLTHARSALPQELDALAEGIVYMIHQGWVRPDAKILGHRDNPAHPGATGCPGDYLYADLPKIRARVAALLNPSPPTIPPGDTVLYFRLNATTPTVWATSDGLVAWRMEGPTLQARGVDFSNLPILASNEAAKMVFSVGLPDVSVR